MAGVTIYGAAWCPDCRRCKRILGEARVRYDWVDVEEDPDAEAFVRRQDAGKLTLPVVVVPDGPVLVAPSGADMLAALGIEPPKDRRFFDLIIVGAGPTGLSAALHALREGIRCLVIDEGEAGGQASQTRFLYGCPGFPEGTPGSEVEHVLRAQAHRYGVRMLLNTVVEEIQRIDGYVVAVLDSGEEFVARSLVIATGVSYHRLGVPGEDELRGAGVHFCASAEGPFYRKAEELMVVGGGSQAGQEALFLTQFAGKVRVLEYSAEFKASPLVLERLRRNPKIELYPSTEVTELTVGPEGKLEAAVVRDRTTGYTFSFNPAAVFIYAGGTPNTQPFAGAVELDEAGFVVTDEVLQTSMPGVFAAGDVRAGSTKQLGGALGEGVAAAMTIRGYLESLGDLAPRVWA